MKRWIRQGAALLALGSLLMAVPGCGTREEKADSRKVSEYPDTLSQGKEWQEFCQITLAGTAEACGDANWIYAPVNLYQSLAMLTEISGGDTRQEIARLLGEEDQAMIRDRSKQLRELAACIPSPQESEAVSELQQSLWLNEKFPLQDSLLESLGRRYEAEVHQGEPGKRLNGRIQKWLNQATHNRLKEQTRSVKMEPDDAMLLYSTLYFQQQWETPFVREETKKGTFHGKAYNTCGNISEKERWQDAKCQFMHQSLQTEMVRTEKYESVALPMEKGSMRIVLPKEGVELEELCTEKAFSDLLALCSEDYLPCEDGGAHAGDTESARVDLYLPQFDFHSELALENVLIPLKVNSLFQHNADFSPVLGRDGQDRLSSDKLPSIYVSQMEQASAISVDENGCSVASYTATRLESKALQAAAKHTYRMRCDRPFLFFIQNQQGMLLFAGAVQRIE